MSLISLDKFVVHNQHWVSLEQFINFDPHLKKLKDLPYVYQPELLSKFPYHTPGIFVIGGGRQIGKTTFLKQSILKLVSEGKIPGESILFLTGELINNGEELRRMLTSYLAGLLGKECVIFIDEVNYIEDWDRFIKFMADAGSFEKCTLVLTGSDIVIIKDAMKRFPGRRGKAEQTNFHYYPLSFSEVVRLKRAVPKELFEEIRILSYEQMSSSRIVNENIDKIYEEFRQYVITGGFLTAINDLAKDGKIHTQTFVTYWEWILGDVLKHGRSENYLREILNGIIKRYGTQITWNSLAKDLSIDHHKTVSDYCDLLGQMDAVFVQQALLEHKLSAAPKKAKKIHFTDPFISHAVHSVLNDIGDPWENYLKPLQNGGDDALAPFVEAVVVTHFRRRFKTFYIKNHGEIDLAYINDRRAVPIEIKWTSQLRPKELELISKYPNGMIAAKTTRISRLKNNIVVPIPILLMKEIS